jgi:hypothetical protein
MYPTGLDKKYNGKYLFVFKVITQLISVHFVLTVSGANRTHLALTFI